MSVRWDVLDIAALVDGALDAFAQNFYGKNFDQLRDQQAIRIIGSMLSYLVELDEASKGHTPDKEEKP